METRHNLSVFKFSFDIRKMININQSDRKFHRKLKRHLVNVFPSVELLWAFHSWQQGPSNKSMQDWGWWASCRGQSHLLPHLCPHRWGERWVDEQHQVSVFVLASCQVLLLVSETTASSFAAFSGKSYNVAMVSVSKCGHNNPPFSIYLFIDTIKNMQTCY